ncbi:MAG: FecR domain-containing protein [Bacteroidota bacterium]
MILNAHQHIAEVITIMRDQNFDSLPVHENGVLIGTISYNEIIEFLGDPDDEQNVYFHKMNFNLGTALHVLKDAEERKDYKLSGSSGIKGAIAIRTIKFAAAAILVLAVFGLSWAAINKYNYIPKKHTSTAKLITIATKHGETQSVKLPDGTTLILNALSEVSYPESFEGLETREIILNGEAFIDSIASGDLPFVVKTDKKIFRPTGNKLNVNAYVDENKLTVTYTNGPGTTEALAWTKGNFLFHDLPLSAAMRQLERWYDVKVVYQNDELSKTLVGATVSKSKSLQDILQLLELSQSINFKTSGKQVAVSN